MKYFIALFWCCAFQMIWAQQTSQLLTDGDFAQFPTAWTESSTNFEVINPPNTSTCPRSGNIYAYARPNLNASGDVYKNITIPANTTRIELNYFVSINTTEPANSGDFDFLKVGLWDYPTSTTFEYWEHDNSTGQVVTLNQLPNSCTSYTSFSRVFTSGVFIGNAQSRTVRVLLESSNDVSNPTVFRVDDITVVATYSNPCTFSLNSSSQSFQSNGGSNTINVNTSSGCTWSASTDCNWVTLNQTSGSGSTSLSYTVSANATQSTRNCTITVNGQTHTITQAGVSCNYSLNPTTQSFQSNGGSASVSVSTNNGCNWTATSSCNWLTLNNNSGSGSGSINYNVTANSTQSTRTCTINVNGQTHLITQSGLNCNYSLNSAGLTFQSNGGNGSVGVTTNNGCSWSAGTDCNWVTLTNPTGTNSGIINYSVATNSASTTRTCTITINGQTHVVTQSGVNSCDLVTPIITTIGCDLKVDAQTNAKYQWQISGNDVANATTRFHTAVRRGFYNCVVTKMNDATCSKISADFYSNCTNGIDKLDAIYAITVFPNPNHGTFMVDFDLPEPKLTTIRIYNALGQCVYTSAATKQAGHQNHPIVLNKATSGLYWVEIQLDDQKMVKKVVVE